MQEQQLWKLIAGKLTGEASLSEQLVLKRYLKMHSSLSYSVDVLTMLWQIKADTSDKMPELVFEKIMKRIQEA